MSMNEKELCTTLEGDQTPAFTTADLIAEVTRELRMRRSLYPRWVDEGRLKPWDAARRIDLMRAILERLQAEHAEEQRDLFNTVGG